MRMVKRVNARSKPFPSITRRYGLKLRLKRVEALSSQEVCPPKNFMNKKVKKVES